MGLSFTDGEVTLVAQEIQKLDRADEGVAIPVESLEGRMGGEVANATEALTCGL